MNRYQEELVLFLDDTFESGKLDWDLLFHKFRNVITELEDPRRTMHFTELVMEMLMEFDFICPVFISRTVDLLFVRNITCVFRPPVQKVQYFSPFLDYCMTSHLEKRMSERYFHICAERDYAALRICLVSGDVRYMKVLARYGVSQDDAHMKQNRIFEHLCAAIVTKARPEDGNFLHTIANIDTCARFIRGMYDVNVNVFRAFLIPKVFASRRRAALIMAAIVIAHLEYKQKNSAEDLSDPEKDYLIAFRYYLATIVEPMVSYSELTRFVRRCMPADESELAEELLSQLRERIPYTVQEYQPRSLKHICRCYLRAELRKNGSLPVLVSELEIPSTLKDYLLVAKFVKPKK